MTTMAMKMLMKWKTRKRISGRHGGRVGFLR